MKRVPQYIDEEQLAKYRLINQRLNNFETEVFESENNDKQYGCAEWIIKELDSIVIPEGVLLQIHTPLYPPLGFIDIEKQTLFEYDQDFLDRITFPFTPTGIWQALVLDDLPVTSFTLFDHDNYNRIYYITEEIDCIETDWTGMDIPRIKKKQLPHIFFDERATSGDICYLVWNDQVGLAKVRRRFKWRNGHVDFNKPRYRKLIKYSCGICF